ncbi:Myosin-binding protein 1 [Spatholobus suberectus]|nr:Myosin-binding protein 1 [Spatholobus suberectus]
MMATTGISSSEWRKLSPNVATALASAFLEWLLIFFLFIDAAISYVITKFAGYCKLQIPCLFCSRLDHVLGKEKRGYYWDLICSGHKTEISSLVLCRAHDKLVNVQGMCETCLFSFATINKSSAETYRLLVGKLGEGSESRFDQDPLLSENASAKCCSCCNKQLVLKGYDQRLVFTKSIGSGTADLDVSNVVGYNFRKKRRAKPFVSRAVQRRNNQADPLSHVGYTELKITSDTESEPEVPLSDDDGTSIPVRGADDTKEDIEVPCEHMEPCILDLNENLASEKLRTSASELQPSLSESGMQLENTDIHGTKSTAATLESRNGLTELDSQQQVERNAVCPSPSEPISINEVPALSNKIGVPVEESKENYDLTTNQVGITSKQRLTMDCEEIIESDDKPTTSEAGLETTPFSSDIGQQNPNLLDLGDAYKLAVSNRGRQLSGMLVEHWFGRDSARISEDLKMLLSQFSTTRGTDLSVNDVSPRLSINSDEVKTSDVSNSAGMQILQKMISLERNESGLSLDGSIVSEVEGESAVDRLKRQVDHDRKLMSALYKELEEERNASAVAANQALAMITRLQEEKATLHMEALQYLRMMDEQSEYETEALQKANDLLVEKETEIEELEAKLEFYRKKFPDESVLENMVETNSEMKVKDIGLDHCIEKDASIPGKSVTENTNISDKAEVLTTSLEKQNVQSVKYSPLDFQGERLYISQRLKKLEKQVHFFLNIHQSQDNWLNSENDKKESPENCEKMDNNILMQESVSSLKLNSDAMGDDSSSKEPPVCMKNGGYNGHSSPVLCGNNDLSSTGSLVLDFIGRLQVLEADLSFLKHSVNLSSNGEEGLKLLQEIADHLQQLRQIGIRELDQPVA